MATNAQKLQKWAEKAGLTGVTVIHHGKGRGFEVWADDKGMLCRVGEYAAIYTAKALLPQDAARFLEKSANTPKRTLETFLQDCGQLPCEPAPVMTHSQHPAPKFPRGFFTRWGMHKRNVQWVLFGGTVALSTESKIDGNKRAPMLSPKALDMLELDAEASAYVEELKAAARAELETEEVEAVLFEAAPEPVTGFMRPCVHCSGTGAVIDPYDGYTRHCSECDGTGIHTPDVCACGVDMNSCAIGSDLCDKPAFESAPSLDITPTEFFALEKLNEQLLNSRSYRESWAVPSVGDLHEYL